MNLLLFMPARRVCGCAGLLLLLAGAVSAQRTEASDPAPVETPGIPPDDFTERSVVTERPVLPYQPVRESDILWESRIWRIVDVREKMNLPFAYPEAPLAQILGEAALAGELTVYDPGDDKFSAVFPTQALRDALYPTETIVTVDVETGLENVQEVEQSPDWTAVKRFRIKEAWFFDTRTGALRFRILGIAPMINVVNSQGDFMYERPLFWVHYPSARPLLARQKAYLHGGNLAATTTWEDLFEMRYFAATVYKDNNLYNRRIEDYLTGVDALYEAKRINDALLHREHDVWAW
ncbi:MAG: gliding motility protein GldN [Saprospiraceae bacterium]|nr:gliding motility protein GldN [Saprospiraceae bacterium]